MTEYSNIQTFNSKLLSETFASISGMTSSYAEMGWEDHYSKLHKSSPLQKDRDVLYGV
jgi:hypothetical protein